MHLLANISLDTPDGDVGAKVGAILPDGRTLVLGQDMVGARFRHGVDKPRLATPGAIEPWRFDGFYSTVRELPKGTRLRPALAPLNTPDLQKNFNSGGRIGYGTAGDADRDFFRPPRSTAPELSRIAASAAEAGHEMTRRFWLPCAFSASCIKLLPSRGTP